MNYLRRKKLSKPIKILYINGNIMKRGGIESFMMNYFRNIDKNRIHIDFVVHGFDEGVYDKEILASGSKIFHVPTKSKHPFSYEKYMRGIFNSGEYQIVHSHLDAMSGWVLKIAKQCNIPVRIAHSHNTDHLTTNKIKYFINEHYRKNICKYATHCFACSEDAGKWLFGNNEFKIICNAINLKDYKFDPNSRRLLRDKHNLSNEYVIGHVGRFDYQKNQEFLVNVLKRLKNHKEKVKLVFVGSGTDRSAVIKMAKDKKLKSDIIFIDSCSNVNEYYSVFDCFVLPSRFEGLGIVAIEAQVNNLPCILSNTVPKSVKISNNVSYLGIDDPEKWAKQIIEYKKLSRDTAILDDIEVKKYDIVNAAYKLCDIYESILADSKKK